MATVSTGGRSPDELVQLLTEFAATLDDKESVELLAGLLEHVSARHEAGRPWKAVLQRGVVALRQGDLAYVRAQLAGPGG